MFCVVLFVFCGNLGFQMSSTQTIPRHVLPLFSLTTTVNEFDEEFQRNFFWFSSKLLDKLPEQRTPLQTRILNARHVTKEKKSNSFSYKDLLSLLNLDYVAEDIWEDYLVFPCQIRYLIEQYLLGNETPLKANGVPNVFLVGCSDNGSWKICPLFLSFHKQYAGNNWAMWLDEGGSVSTEGQSLNCNLIL